MNKNIIDDEISIAYSALKKSNIVTKSNKVDSGYRNQIVTFGSSVMGGSLRAAIAFFSKKQNTGNDNRDIDRTKLLRAIEEVLRERGVMKEKSLFEYADKHKNEAKEEVINAAIALKLALNLYPVLEPEENKNEKKC